MNPEGRDRRIGTVMLGAAALWVAELAAFRQFLAGPWSWDWTVHATLPDAALLAAAAAVMLLWLHHQVWTLKSPTGDRGPAPVLDVLRGAGGGMLAPGRCGQLFACGAGSDWDDQHAAGTFERHSGRGFGRGPVFALLRRFGAVERGGAPAPS